MAQAGYTITVTRWMLLRLLLTSWRDACVDLGVSPLHPVAIWCLTRAVVAILLG